MLDTLRERVNELICDVSEGRREVGDVRDAILALVAEDRAALVEALEEYGSHQLSCLLAHWSHGRPTKDGGYETMYAGKWYQRGDKPACTCGLDAALAAVKDGK